MSNDFEQISKTVIDGAPNHVSEHMVDTPPVEKPHDDSQQFDPKIHRINKKTGEPVRKKDGSFALKPGSGSPKKSSLGTPNQPSPDAPMIQQGPSAGAEALGKFTTETFFALNMQLFGKAAIPTDETKLSLTHATSLYMESKGFDKDISPGVMIIMVMSGYYAQVLTHQEPRSKVKKAANWITRRFRRGSRIDSGTNGERKNNNE